ncbi:MAG TPA: F0F1 ATP synthase subunit delta [Humibacter sp.]|nr:F0F1 ATP synthase subunit delta [Humibacter sp.]
MGSATREALAQARATLDSTDAVTLATGEALLVAARAINASPALRAVLADPVVEFDRKSTLIASIFGSLGEPAVTLLRGIAESRWSNPAQLIDGIEEIGIRAIARSTGGDAGIESELFEFSRVVSQNPSLELAIGSKLGDSESRVALVDALLSGEADPATVAIVHHLVQSPRGRRIGALLATAADIVADAAGAVVATITAADEPSAAQLDTLKSLITSQYGRTPRFNLIVDPELVGGLRVQVGDQVVDGSIAARLADLRLRLVG